MFSGRHPLSKEIILCFKYFRIFYLTAEGLCEQVLLSPIVVSEIFEIKGMRPYVMAADEKERGIRV